jgi:AAA+ ATPase superfamily predicted ATPase
VASNDNSSYYKLSYYSCVNIVKPAILHDRDRHWQSLAEFAESPAEGARLALVYGRRRQGKTLMLDLLARATGGLIFTGLAQAGRLNLRRLARDYATYTGGPVPAFEDWEQAVDHLLRLGERRGEPTVVVLDEFPYLIDSEPALPSIVQVALEPLSRARSSGRTRLVLCGSALHVMRGLLAGPAPLRGRADYEILVEPFGYRDSAVFWGLESDPDLAFRVHALVGGTPAYRAMCGIVPGERAGFADWVTDGLLNPDRAIFREGATLLYEEPGIADPALYYSVLGAISHGACRRSEIAGLLGRSENSLGHALAMLERVGLIQRVDDAFRQRRPVYRIAEPVLRLHQLIIAPNEAELIGGAAARVWADCADTVAAKIYGPHLKELARQWCLWHAGPATLGGRPSIVVPATLACRVHQRSHELDVVVIRKHPGAADEVLAIGEVKSTTKPVGEAEMRRLEHIRELVPATGGRVGRPRLLLFSRAGFSQGLEAVSRDDLELIDLARLYQGR